MRRWSPAMVGLVVGCTGPELIFPAENLEDARTVVWSVEDSTGGMGVGAGRIEAGAIRIPIRDETEQVEILLYDSDAADYLADLADIENIAPDGHPLPDPDRVYVTRALDAESRFEKEASLSPALGSFRVVPPPGCPTIKIERTTIEAPAERMLALTGCPDRPTCGSRIIFSDKTSLFFDRRDLLSVDTTDTATTSGEELKAAVLVLYGEFPPPDVGFLWGDSSIHFSFDGGSQIVTPPAGRRLTDFDFRKDGEGQMVILAADEMGEVWCHVEGQWSSAFSFPSPSEQETSVLIRGFRSGHAFNRQTWARGELCNPMGGIQLPIQGELTVVRHASLAGAYTLVAGTTTGELIARSSPDAWSVVAEGDGVGVKEVVSSGETVGILNEGGELSVLGDERMCPGGRIMDNLLAARTVQGPAETGEWLVHVMSEISDGAFELVVIRMVFP